MTSLLKKGGGTFAGIKMPLCENPLPPLDEAIAATREELDRSGYYTELSSIDDDGKGSLPLQQKE